MNQRKQSMTNGINYQLHKNNQRRTNQSSTMNVIINNERDYQQRTYVIINNERTYA